MITLSAETKIFISNQPVDMRKNIDGLSCIVSDVLNKSPQSQALYIFYNRAKDKIKILTWHRNGFVLFYKRLEKHKYKFPKAQDEIYSINHEQLSWLIAGLDFDLMQTFEELNYQHYF